VWTKPGELQSREDHVRVLDIRSSRLLRSHKLERTRVVVQLSQHTRAPSAKNGREDVEAVERELSVERGRDVLERGGLLHHLRELSAREHRFE